MAGTSQAMTKLVGAEQAFDHGLALRRDPGECRDRGEELQQHEDETTGQAVYVRPVRVVSQRQVHLHKNR